MTTTTDQRTSPRRALSRWHARKSRLVAALLTMTLYIATGVQAGTPSAQGATVPVARPPAAVAGSHTALVGLRAGIRRQTPDDSSIPVAPLLDDNLLSPTAGVTDTLFSATAAQITALHALEQQAVADTLADHGLPGSDANAASTWGRDDAESELFLLLTQAAKTPPISRTQVQSDAVAWLTTVLQRDDVQAEQDAGLEYVKWAGLDEPHYNALLSQHADAGTLANFFTRGTGNPDPANVYTQQDGSQTGYCNYAPPAPDSASYSDRGNQTCYVPCQSGAGCLPFGPTTNQFIQWGVDDSTYPDVSNPDYEANAVGVAAGVGLATAAGLGLGIGGLVLGSVAAGVGSTAAGAAVGTGALSLIFPIGAIAPVVAADGTVLIGGSVGGAAVFLGGAVAGAILVPVIAVVTGAFYAVDLFQSDQVPGNLASVIAAGPPPIDLGSAFQDTQQTATLFGLFIKVMGPTPLPFPTCAITSGEHPCTSFPAIPDASSSDPEWAVTAQSSGVITYTPTLNFVDQTTGAAHQARVYENWVVDGGVQTLRLNWSDWNHIGETGWITSTASGAYQFITLASSTITNTAVNPVTCVAQQTCSLTDTINIIGTDGQKYTAKLQPSQGPVIAQTSIPGNQDAGAPITFMANATSPLNLPLTYSWRFGAGLFACPLETVVLYDNSTGLPATDPNCIGGNEYGPPVSGATVSHTFAAAGDYTARLTVTDSAGVSTVRLIPFTVYPNPAQVPTSVEFAPIAPPNGSCAGCDQHTVPLGDRLTLDGVR